MELIVVVGTIAILSVLVGRTMVGLFRAEDRTTDALFVGRTLDRLGSRFRSDIRAAEETTLDGANLVARTTEGEITYAPVAKGVERTIREDGEVVATDLFRLGSRQVSFETDDEGRRASAVLVPLSDRPRFVWRTDVRLPREGGPS